MHRTPRLREIIYPSGDRNYFFAENLKGEEIFAFATPVGFPESFSLDHEPTLEANRKTLRKRLNSLARWAEQKSGKSPRTVNAYTCSKGSYEDGPTQTTYTVQFYKATFLDRHSAPFKESK